MTVYLVLISVTFLSPIVMRSIVKDSKKADAYALGVSAVVLFLVFALRAPSVGRDIVGYKDMYEQLAKHSKYGVDTYWTERGYELLEIFFGRYLHADWQVFLAFCNGVSVLSYYLFIKKHSFDPSFSLLIYILMGYMIFDISAVRTMLAIAICLFVVPLFDKKGIWPPVVVIFAVIMVATQIHSSAYIFFILYLLHKIPINNISMFIFIALPLFFFAFRTQIMRWAINNFKTSTVDGGFSLGGNAILYSGILVFAVILFLISRDQKGMSLKNIGKTDSKTKGKFRLKDAFGDVDPSIMLSFRMVYAGTIFLIFTGSNILARMTEYGLIFTIILLPNMISRLEIKSRFLVKTGTLIFLALYFYMLKVKVNELDFLPYVFFWKV